MPINRFRRRLRFLSIVVTLNHENKIVVLKMIEAIKDDRVEVQRVWCITLDGLQPLVIGSNGSSDKGLIVL